MTWRTFVHTYVRINKEGVMLRWPGAIIIATLLYGGQYIGLSYQSGAERRKIEAHNAEQDQKIAECQQEQIRSAAVQQFLVDEVAELHRQLDKQKVAPNVTRIAPQPAGDP